MTTPVTFPTESAWVAFEIEGSEVHEETHPVAREEADDETDAEDPEDL